MVKLSPQVSTKVSKLIYTQWPCSTQ